MAAAALLEKVVSLAGRHGFVYPVECLVNKSAVTCYSYGILGSRVRRHLTNEWWNSMLVEQSDIYAVESSQLQLIIDGDRTLTKSKSRRNSKHCSTTQQNICVRQSLHNGLLSHYLPTLSQLRQRLPFGLAEEGTSLCQSETEEDGEHFLFSCRESRSLTMQYYTLPSQATEALYSWQRYRLQWWKKFAGVSASFTAVDVDTPDGSQPCETHIQYAFPWGRGTVEVLRNHGDTPLLQLEARTGISHQGTFGKKLVLPHMVECDTKLERGLLALLLDAFHERDGAAGQSQTVMKFHTRLAPFQVAIVCSATKSISHLQEVADHVTKELRHAGISALDLRNTTTAAETQFTEFDEIGIPWTVVLKESTLVNGLVLLRNRDTTIKEKISIANLTEKLRVYNLTY